MDFVHVPLPQGSVGPRPRSSPTQIRPRPIFPALPLLDWASIGPLPWLTSLWRGPKTRQTSNHSLHFRSRGLAPWRLTTFVAETLCSAFLPPLRLRPSALAFFPPSQLWPRALAVDQHRPLFQHSPFCAVPNACFVPLCTPPRSCDWALCLRSLLSTAFWSGHLHRFLHHPHTVLRPLCACSALWPRGSLSLPTHTVTKAHHITVLRSWRGDFFAWWLSCGCIFAGRGFKAAGCVVRAHTCVTHAVAEYMMHGGCPSHFDVSLASLHSSCIPRAACTLAVYARCLRVFVVCDVRVRAEGRGAAPSCLRRDARVL